MKLRRLISVLLVMVLLVSAVPVNAFAKGEIKQGMAWVKGTNLRLRSAARTNSKVLDYADKGEVVVVISKHGDWYKVIYDLKTGYMHGDYLKVLTKENVELGYGKINGSNVNLRSGAGTSYKSVAKGAKNDKVYIIGINTGWYKVLYGSKICYIRSDYVDLTEIPYENDASTNSPKFFRNGKSTGVTPSAAALKNTAAGNSGSANNAAAVKVTGSKIVSTAKQYLGVPYVWGGASPSGFDCSGFVYYIYNSLGIKISRTQKTMYAQGTPVEKENLKKGDLVFFQGTYKSGISHVGIYVGNGQFIHSPHSGQVVSYSSLNSGYYEAHYYGACRYV